MCQAAPAKPVTSPGRLEEAGGWPVPPPALPPLQPRPSGLFSGRPSFYPRLAALRWPQELGLGPGDAGHLGAGCQSEDMAGSVYWGWF